MSRPISLNEQFVDCWNRKDRTMSKENMTADEWFGDAGIKPTGERTMSKTDRKHTPLPWKRFGSRIFSDIGVTITICKRETDADFIERACNSHYDLLEALEYVESVAPLEASYSAWEPDELVTVTITVQGLRDLRAAIAKAIKGTEQ